MDWRPRLVSSPASLLDAGVPDAGGVLANEKNLDAMISPLRDCDDNKLLSVRMPGVGQSDVGKSVVAACCQLEGDKRP